MQHSCDAPFNYSLEMKQAKIQTAITKQIKKSCTECRIFMLGWMTGFEPATLGTTNRCSNQLSYNHRLTNGKFNRIQSIVKILSQLFYFCQFNRPTYIHFNDQWHFCIVHHPQTIGATCALCFKIA
jgi:hypothetical protein